MNKAEECARLARKIDRFLNVFGEKHPRFTEEELELLHEALMYLGVSSTIIERRNDDGRDQR